MPEADPTEFVLALVAVNVFAATVFLDKNTAVGAWFRQEYLPQRGKLTLIRLGVVLHPLGEIQAESLPLEWISPFVITLEADQWRCALDSPRGLTNFNYPCEAAAFTRTTARVCRVYKVVLE